MPRKHPKRVETTLIDEKKAEEAAISDFFSDIAPVLNDEPPIEANTNPSALASIIDQPASAPPATTPGLRLAAELVPLYTDEESQLSPDAHDYLKRQTLIELYGTDNPSTYDRQIRTINQQIQRYGR